MHIIVCIEDPAIIRKILNHLAEKSPMDSGADAQYSRTPTSLSVQLILLYQLNRMT